MRLLNSLLFGFYLIATLASALPIIDSVGNAELRTRELLFPRGDVSTSQGILKRSTPPSPTTGHHLTAAQQELIKEAHKKDANLKMEPAAVINIWKTTHSIPKVDTDILFLEEGDEKAGMKHIWKAHGDQFTLKGIKESEIPHLIEEATTAAGPIGAQGKKKRPIFKASHGGQELYLAISIGSNGFVVGMNPCSKPDTCVDDE